MSGAIRWGISSTGGIATSFAQALRRVSDAHLMAVSSRTADRASAFAAEHEVPRSYGSLSEMLEQPDIDVAYIASPHSEHCRQALQVLEAGKHVLVEKPFGLSSDEVRPVLDAAERANVFVMEALWTRFLPAVVRLRKLVADGALGDIRSVDANFGFPMPEAPEHRLLNPHLGGGALLDLGIYPVNTAVQLLGHPDQVSAVAEIGPTGVDVNTALTMRFGSGAVATAQCSLTTLLPSSARISGSQGWVEIPMSQHHPDSFLLKKVNAARNGVIAETLMLPIGGDGLRYQVAEVHRCIREGLVQSPSMSWQDSLDLMSVLDRARACIGLRYPGE